MVNKKNYLMYNRFLMEGIGMMFDMQERNKKKLKEIEAEWVNSRNYPRKKKKRVRKHLIVEYSIFSYAKEIFDFN